MIIMGVDLAGPSNLADTAVAAFFLNGEGIQLRHTRTAVSDTEIFELASAYNAAGPLIIGLDAPLSYQPGGGDRPGDRRLRRAIQAIGMPPGSVMPPTMTRMVYLTVRGMGVAWMLGTLNPPPQVLEVHPGAAMGLRGAPVTAVRGMKSDPAARQELLTWLAAQGLHGLETITNPSDHLVAAVAAALAAWQFAQGRPQWHEPADPPHHPFDYAA